MKIVIINGKTGAGKDTFVEFVKEYKNVLNIHTSDRAKTALALLGWDGETYTDSIRDILADMMVISELMFKGVTKFVTSKINNVVCTKDVVFLHVREKARILDFLHLYPEAITLWIERPNLDISIGIHNESDQKVEEYKCYDFVLNNCKDVKYLQEAAREFSERWL